MINKIWQRVDKIDNYRAVFFWFLLIWLVINLVQSFFTELAHDEAYYWMYSRNLAWGYFDHPPMIAILVKIGYTLFKNELGVRLLSALLGTSTFLIIFLILREELKSISLLIVILTSVLLLQTHVGGFLAIPDLPLIFFAALFFLLYKKYLENDTWGLAVLLGIAGSAMLYSKYHAVLVLFFTLISNLNIFRRKTFWIIPIIMVGAMIPHLMWQINNNFPTFGYHLVGRSSAYSIERTLNYLGGQFLMAGPLVSIILFYHSIKAKTEGDLFLKSMKFNFYGFFLFFLLSSFKGHVEPHWTAIGFIPLVVLSYRSLLLVEKAQYWLRILYLPSIIGFIFIRLALMIDFVPQTIPVSKEFHDWDKWADDIKQISGERKVVFINSFQYPSKYSFYSGGAFSHTLNSLHYRQNQYDLWGFERDLQGEDVFLMGPASPQDTILSEIGPFTYKVIENFKSYYDVEIEIDTTNFEVSPGKEIFLNARIINPRTSELIFQSSDTTTPPQLNINFHDGKWIVGVDFVQYLTDTIGTGEELPVFLRFLAPQDKGEFSAFLSIENDQLYAPFNSEKLNITVK